MTAYIIAGAPSPDLGFISANIPADGFVLCADKGYSYALRAGVMPDVIIGDFDSCTDPIPEADFVTRLPREKDYTDTVHCIDKAIKLGYDDIVLFAATGGRLDHTVGNLCALAFARDRGVNAVMLSPQEEIRLLDKGLHRFKNRGGLTFSLFPFGCEAAVLSIRGAHYPLESGTLRSGVPIGVSNVFEGESCELEIESGRVLMIVNTDGRLV